MECPICHKDRLMVFKCKLLCAYREPYGFCPRCSSLVSATSRDTCPRCGGPDIHPDTNGFFFCLGTHGGKTCFEQWVNS